jgi:DNA-binding CsgD family transcriptional regulator
VEHRRQDIPQLFGRERELRAAVSVLDQAGPRGLVLSGEAGIGKTAVWRAVIVRARERGFAVLCAMPSGAEVQLTYAALGDIVDGLGESALAELPKPRREALEIALLRAAGAAVDARAVGVALLEMLRASVARQPILIGLDDLQWLDGPSARALGFALRRIADSRVIVAATLRTQGPEAASVLDLAAVLGPQRVRRLDIRPLTLAATHELVVGRLGAEPSRAAMTALFDAAGGNPFMAGELAEELIRRDAPVPAGAQLPLPPSVRQLVEARFARLSPEARDLLLAAGSLARPTAELLSRLRPDATDTLRSAAEAGLIEPDFELHGVHFTHPLHSRVPFEALEPVQRRRLHQRLARVVDDLEERARHRALAATRPSAATAGELERAATAAGARGAPVRAAELFTLAARLSPAADASRRGRRILAAAHWHQRAGDGPRGAALAEALLSAPGASGDLHAQALSLLGTVRADLDGVPTAIALYERGRREAGASAATRSEIHRRIAWLRIGGGEVPAAARHARAASALARASGRDGAGQAGARAIEALAMVIEGEPAPKGLPALAGSLLTELADTDPWPETSPAVVAAVALLWAGEIEQARPPMEHALARATESDEPYLAMHALAYLSAMGIATGELKLARERARTYAALAQEAGQRPQLAAAQWPLAMAHAWLGEEGEARTAAGDGLVLAGETGHVLYQTGCLAALGLLELSLGRHWAASEWLHRAGELAAESGIRALGRLPLLPDAIEALAATGRLEAAAELQAELAARASRLGAPWALAQRWRCEGLLAEARGAPEQAVAAFRQALEHHGRQNRLPECARTQLALGRVLRRERQKRAAREALESAEAAFAAMGARLWAEQARRELARIGGRSSSGGRLTGTEGSIAELVAAGRTNQEVAHALHLSPRTVEWNLSKIYRKLGVRGRTELAAAVAGAGTVTDPDGAENPGVPGVDRAAGDAYGRRDDDLPRRALPG